MAATLRAVAEDAARQYCDAVVAAAAAWLASLSGGLAAAVAAAAEAHIRKLSPSVAAELPHDWSEQLSESLHRGLTSNLSPGAGGHVLQDAQRQLHSAVETMIQGLAATSPLPPLQQKQQSSGGGGGGGGGSRRGVRGGGGRDRERGRERDRERKDAHDDEAGSTGVGG
ncbi:hypothetical protein Vretifemale_16936, partial [Volvox reticuliferus]